MKSLTLPQFLAKYSEEIKTAFTKNKDISMLIILQQKLVFASEDEIIAFAGYLVSLNYPRVSSTADCRLNTVNVVAYMSLVNTAKARIILLSQFHGSDSVLQLELLKEVSI